MTNLYGATSLFKLKDMGRDSLSRTESILYMSRCSMPGVEGHIRGVKGRV